MLKCQKRELQIKLQFVREVGQGWSLIVYMLEAEVATCYRVYFVKFGEDIYIIME